MKKILFTITSLLMLVFFSSCQKNNISDEISPSAKLHYIKSNAVSATNVVFQIPNDLLVSPNEYGTEAIKGTYLNTTLVTYRLDSKITKGKSLIIYELNEKHFGALLLITTQKDKLRRIKLSSLTNNDFYYSFMINSENAIGYFSVGNPVPFSKLANSNTSKLSSNNNLMNVGDNSSCMQRKWDSCMANWECAVSCGLTLPECVAGMGIACLVEAI